MIPNINIRKILVLLLYVMLVFLACQDPKIKNSEVNALFPIMVAHEYKENSNIIVTDQIAPITKDFYFEKGKTFFLDENGKYLKENDIKCFEKQRKIFKNVKFWSELLTETKYNLIDIYKVSNDSVFSKEWWENYTKLYGTKELIQFSYPLFNCKENKIINIAYHYNSENSKKNIREISVFIKDKNGIWNHSGYGDLLFDHSGFIFKSKD